MTSDRSLDSKLRNLRGTVVPPLGREWGCVLPCALAGRLILGTDVWGQAVPCSGGCIVYHRMFSNIPDLNPLEASSPPSQV